MSDDIMEQIRARQARERGAREDEAQKKRDALGADRSKFAREAPQVISIMRQRHIAPQPVVLCVRTLGKYWNRGQIGRGWMLRGLSKEPLYGYPQTVHVALLEDGTCVTCVPRRDDFPHSTRKSLVVLETVERRRHWDMDFDVASEVRRLIGE